MKLYTEEQVRVVYNLGFSDANNNFNRKEDETINFFTPIKLPSDEEIFWNIENPKNIDNYIVNKGADGVSLGWWNGTGWIKMWGSEEINVYGWIQMPIHKEQILNQNK